MMYTLRLAPALLADLDVEPSPAAVATTRLGDWDVVPLAAAGRPLLVCVSDRTDLAIVLPRPAPADLPEALGIALVPVLRALGVPDAAIVAELDEMAAGTFDILADRSRARRARTVARRAAVLIEQGSRAAVDVAGLHGRLAARRGPHRGTTIADRTRAVFDMADAGH